MLAGFEAATNAWPAEQIHVEYFTPKFAAAQEGGLSSSWRAPSAS